MAMRSWLILSLAGISGCAGLPEVVAPERVFDTLEPVKVTAPEYEQPEHIPPPAILERVACSQPTPCYTGPVDTEEVGAYTPEQVRGLLSALDQGVEAVEGANALSGAVRAHQQEVNALIRLGRLTEAQQAIQAQQTAFYRDAYRQEWWTTRVGVLAALLLMGL